MLLPARKMTNIYQLPRSNFAEQYYAVSLKLSVDFGLRFRRFDASIPARIRPFGPKAESDRESRTNSTLERQPTNFCSKLISCATRPRPWALSLFLSLVNNARRYCVSMPIPTLTGSDNSVDVSQLPMMGMNLSRDRLSLFIGNCLLSANREYYFLNFRHVYGRSYRVR